MLRTLVETPEADTMIQRDVERQRTADWREGRTQEFGGIEGGKGSRGGFRGGWSHPAGRRQEKGMLEHRSAE